MTDSTLDIHVRLIDALQAFEEVADGQMDASVIEAGLSELEVDKLESQVQALDSLVQDWDAADAAHATGVTDAFMDRHETAATEASNALDPMQASLETEGQSLGARIDHIQATLENFSREDTGIRTQSFGQHNDFTERTRMLTGTYANGYLQLQVEFQQFGSLLEQQLQPGMDRLLGEWLNELQTFQSDRIGAANAELRNAFAQAAQQYMDLAENVANVYRDAAKTASGDLENFATEKVSAMLNQSVERLKNTAISMVETEVAQAISETGLSVAITSALSPIMPELIAFYKAVTLLEEAIRIYKEMKSALTFGL
jgi:hypothetical protein